MKKLLVATLPTLLVVACAGWYAEISVIGGESNFTRPDTASSFDTTALVGTVGHNFGQKAHQTAIEGLLTKQALFDQEMDRRAAVRSEEAALHNANMEKYALAALTVRGVDTQALQDSPEAELDLSDFTDKPEDLNAVVVWLMWIAGICILLLTAKHVGILNRFLPPKPNQKDEDPR